MRAALMIMTVMYSSKCTKVEVVSSSIVLPGIFCPFKPTILVTKCARSKTFMRAEGWAQEEKKKS